MCLAHQVALPWQLEAHHSPRKCRFSLLLFFLGGGGGFFLFFKALQWAQTDLKPPFLLIAMWGSSRSITLGLGHIHLTHIFPGIFAFHKVGATRESSSIRKGIFAEKSVGFQSRFAGKYDGLVHPHSR